MGCAAPRCPIIDVPKGMRRCHSLNLGARPRSVDRTQPRVGGCCGLRKRSPREPSSLEQHGRAAHGRGKGRWRACSRGTGKPSSARRLDSTCLVREDGSTGVICRQGIQRGEGEDNRKQVAETLTTQSRVNDSGVGNET